MANTETITIPKAEYDLMVSRLAMLNHELAQLKRMIFGAKSERHITIDPKQGTLFDLPTEDLPQPKQEQISYSRNKPVPANKAKRLELPLHLPRREEVVEPDDLPEGAHKVGEKITEVLEYEPGTLYVRKIVRPYYVGNSTDEKTEFIVAELPTRALPKSNAGEGLLAHVFVGKFVDHLPFYRQVQMFKRQGVELAEPTINGWFASTMQLLEPLYDVLKAKVFQTDYLMADETPIPVQTRDKPGATHRGFHWVYYNPLDKKVLFDYRKGRGREGPGLLLKDYKGHLQTDGYSVYETLTNKANITHLACMAHARRYFEKAKDNDKPRSDHALALFRSLYAVEQKAREHQHDANQRKQLRQKEAVPILVELKQWLDDQARQVLPSSAIGKAIAYALGRWPALKRYIEDGRFEIDNNLVENSIRPVAIGRKNYMFAGSHDAAQRMAMMYSFMATCKINGVEPFAWLKDTLTRIPDHPANRLEELLPGY